MALMSQGHISKNAKITTPFTAFVMTMTLFLCVNFLVMYVLSTQKHYLKFGSTACSFEVHHLTKHKDHYLYLQIAIPHAISSKIERRHAFQTNSNTRRKDL